MTSDQKQFGWRLNSSDGTGGPQPSPSGMAKSTLAHTAEEPWARLGLLWGDSALPADGDRKMQQILFTDWEACGFYSVDFSTLRWSFLMTYIFLLITVPSKHSNNLIWIVCPWILLNKADVKFLNKVSLRFGFEKEERRFTQPMTADFFKGLARHFQEKQFFPDERLHRRNVMWKGGVWICLGVIFIK